MAGDELHWGDKIRWHSSTNFCSIDIFDHLVTNLSSSGGGLIHAQVPIQAHPQFS